MPLPPVPPISDVVLFRDGSAYVAREIAVAPGAKFVKFRLPAAVQDGTLWFEATDGIKVDNLRTRLTEVEEPIKKKVTTVTEILLGNIGKVVTLTSPGTDGKSVRVDQGQLLSVAGANVTLKTAKGTLRSINLGVIQEVDTKGLAMDRVGTAKQPVVEQILVLSAVRAGKVRVLTVEKGPRWVPSYRLNLTNLNAGTLTCKYTLASSGGSFVASRVRALDGQPAWPANPPVDLAVGAGGVDAYAGGINSQRSFFDSIGIPKDPFDELIAKFYAYRQARQMMDGAQAYGYQGMYQGGMGGGGFGGGSGGAGGPGGIRAVFADPSTNAMLMEAGSPALRGRLLDLTTFDLGRISLANNERLTRDAFTDKVSIKRLYRSTGPLDQIAAYRRPEDNQIRGMESILRLQNAGKNSWISGQVFVDSQGLPMAQTPLPFTRSGGDGDLILGNAQDLVPTFDITEIKRDTRRYPSDNNNWIDRTVVRYRVTVRLLNPREDGIDIEISPLVYGKVLEAGPFTFKLAGSVSSPYNQDSQLSVRATVEPGKEFVATFEYERVL